MYRGNVRTMPEKAAARPHAGTYLMCLLLLLRLLVVPSSAQDCYRHSCARRLGTSNTICWPRNSPVSPQDPLRSTKGILLCGMGLT